MKKLTQIEAIKELSTKDHAFLNLEGVKRYTEPFGFEGSVQKTQDTRSQLKGLTLSGINPETGKEFVEGDSSSGMDADIIAMEIAHHLGVEYAPMYGKGSQLRSACDAVKEHLQTAKKYKSKGYDSIK